MPHMQNFKLAFCVFCVAAARLVAAQTPAPGSPTVTVTEAPASDIKTDRRIERIRIEDAGSRIDELRVGGETQSITVSPKGGMPAYDVLPPNSNRSLANDPRNGSANSGGTRVWKILGF